MVTLFVFYVHTVAAVYAFTDQYQEEGLGAGTLAVAFMGIVFSVGWSISTFILKFLYRRKGVRDVLQQGCDITRSPHPGEAVFYYLFLKGMKKKGPTYLEVEDHRADLVERWLCALQRLESPRPHFFDRSIFQPSIPFPQRLNRFDRPSWLNDYTQPDLRVDVDAGRIFRQVSGNQIPAFCPLPTGHCTNIISDRTSGSAGIKRGGDI